MSALKFGFTTGSCAAAGSKACAYMLLSGRIKEKITIVTPKGLDFNASIKDIDRKENQVTCSVIKDGGDDPDVTTGCHIVSKVSFIRDPDKEKKGEAFVIIEGGKGVGRVTKPGLDQKPGNAAINHVPREMIEKEVLEVCRLFDYNGGLSVEISVPEGEKLAEKTFNPRLGITGGISILGTSGVVEPMSMQAIKDTILVELKMQKASGKTVAAVSPGNYGLDFMKENFGFDLDKSVKCSNFIGDTVDMAVELGFKKLLLTGHTGKLIKVSGGIMNTHSREGDCRMELMSSFALKAGGTLELCKSILDCVSTEEALALLKEEGLLEKTMNLAMEKIMFFLNKRAAGKIEIGCMMYANGFGLVSSGGNAETILEEAKSE